MTIAGVDVCCLSYDEACRLQRRYVEYSLRNHVESIKMSHFEKYLRYVEYRQRMYVEKHTRKHVKSIQMSYFE